MHNARESPMVIQRMRISSYNSYYLLYENLPPTLWRRRASTPRKETVKKRETSDEQEKDRGIPGNWRAHKRRRTNGKTAEETKKRTPNPATLDHSVASYDPQGSMISPTLYNIYVCDLPPTLGHTKKFIYTDYVTQIISTALPRPNLDYEWSPFHGSLTNC